MQHHGRQDGEGHGGPQPLRLRVEAVAVAEGVGEVEQGADAADPEHGGDQAFMRVRAAAEQAREAGGRPDEQDEERSDQCALPGEGGQGPVVGGTMTHSSVVCSTHRRECAGSTDGTGRSSGSITS
ncbi:hypothetical protein ACPCTN_32595 [Streptomyces cinereoruber]|uniref:hypothetical protein n=1 Tax=Streptomyces cinereoruber TaxID=67260 RepID=UPI003C2E87BD